MEVEWEVEEIEDVSDRKEQKEEKGEKIITKVFWIYNDNVILHEKSKYYVDMDLVVKTENYSKGERVSVSIKSDDGKLIVNNLSELVFEGIVDEKGEVVIKKPFKNYTLIIK